MNDEEREKMNREANKVSPVHPRYLVEKPSPYSADEWKFYYDVAAFTRDQIRELRLQIHQRTQSGERKSKIRFTANAVYGIMAYLDSVEWKLIDAQLEVQERNQTISQQAIEIINLTDEINTLKQKNSFAVARNAELRANETKRVVEVTQQRNDERVIITKVIGELQGFLQNLPVWWSDGVPVEFYDYVQRVVEGIVKEATKSSK